MEIADKALLDAMIEEHQMWLEDFRNGDSNVRNVPSHYKANFSLYHILGYDFHGADLSMAIMAGAYINDCNMRDVTLNGATITRTGIKNTDLALSHCIDTTFDTVHFYNVNFTDAQCCDSSFINDTFDFCNLKDTELMDARFLGCFFKGTSLGSALRCNIPMTCPDTGSFIGWKKAYVKSPDIESLVKFNWERTTEVIVKLEIQEDARRSSAGSRKCRCDKAKVLSITSLDGIREYDTAYSFHDASFVYRVGETVSVDNFCTNRWNECAAGIHFFITRDEAVNYI